MTGTMSRISDGLRPASTSSSSSSFGSVASARASSSRLRPATVSVRAGRSSMSPRPTSRADLLGRRERLGARADGADARRPAMFSRTDQAGERLHDLEGAGDAAPRQPMRRLAGDVVAGIADAPSARLQEAGDHGRTASSCRRRSGRSAPVMRPASADSEAALTASRPPKRRDTPSTERSGSAMRHLPRSAAQRAARTMRGRRSADQAARREAR